MRKQVKSNLYSAFLKYKLCITFDRLHWTNFKYTFKLSLLYKRRMRKNLKIWAINFLNLCSFWLLSLNSTIIKRFYKWIGSWNIKFCMKNPWLLETASLSLKLLFSHDFGTMSLALELSKPGTEDGRKSWSNVHLPHYPLSLLLNACNPGNFTFSLVSQSFAKALNGQRYPALPK